MEEVSEAERQRLSVMTRGVDQDIAGQTLLPAVVEGVLGSLGGKSFHSFKGSTLDVWKQISIATGPDVVPASEKLDNPFDLVHYYCHQIKVAGPTPGEYKDAIRCVLIDKDGAAFAFSSDGVALDLGRLIATFGLGPYDPPIKIRVKQFQTRMGRRAYTIQPG